MDIRFKFDNTHVCYVCPLANKRRLSIISNNHTAKPFDFIHCDIWGPYHSPTYAGHRFFLTLVDDHTHFTWTYLIKQKFQAPKIVMDFFYGKNTIQYCH